MVEATYARDGDVPVSVDRLSFSYGAGVVLHEISFVLRQGEVVGLLGRNGAGKSTTFKILAGSLPPSSGTVRVAGHAMPDNAVEAKKQIGYVPEAPNLFESLTGQEFLELMGRLHNVPEERLQRRIQLFLNQFGLADNRLRPLGTYSRGNRQKVLLSAALLHNPKIVLLDEPLSGVDVDGGIMFRDLIRALALQGKVVLYSSHVLGMIERVCSRALIIDRGRLVADDAIDSLKASTHRSSLEDVFRQLTPTEGAADAVEELVAGLRSP